MKSEKDPDNVTKQPSGVSRRTLVKGAAWSVPAVAVAVAAPIASASVPCAAGSKTFAAPSSSSPRSVAWTVPSGVTEVTYSVIGGAGGGNSGGSGGKVTGTLPVTPGDVLDIFVGQGGQATGGTSGPATNYGGRGYGDGGTAAPGGDQINDPSYISWVIGGGGGGGSAIVRGGTPLVVAGGGGGSGACQALGSQVSLGGDLSGGDAGRSASSVNFYGATVSASIVAYGGQSGSSGGAGGSGQNWSGNIPQPGFYAGDNGTQASGSTGGNGGNSHLTGLSSADNNPPTGVTGAGGGGGGGYRGGGGGETEAGNADNNQGMQSLGAGGGGGSSYVAPGVTGSIGLAGNAGSSNGTVQLSWTCP